MGWLAFALASLLLPAAPALADGALVDGALEVSADTVVIDRRRALYEARGNVVVREPGRTLTADWALLHADSGRGVASGRVVMHKGGDTLRAAFLEFDTVGGTGVVFDGSFDAEASGFEMRGAEIAQTDRDTYHFVDGVFTTCRCPHEEHCRPWEIAASEADLEVGGYATGKSTRFRILGVPVLWLPWMIYPVKTERQSGFLLPEVGLSGRSGFEVGVPFFWAARPDLNVTVTPSWLEKRGAKGDLAVEYVLGRESSGSLLASGLRDADVDPGTAATPFDRARWSVSGVQDLHLPGELRLTSDFAFVSDNDYPYDFRELRDRRRDRFLESVAFVGRGFGPAGGLGAWVGAFHADDLQSPDDEDRDRFLLQRLPHVELRALPGPLPGPAAPLVAALDVEYSHFRPRDPATSVLTLAPAPGGAAVVGRSVFLDTGSDGLPSADERGFAGNPDPHRDDAGSEGDGIFQEGEPLADRGHRIDLWPRLGLPLRLFDRLELYSEAGWRQTLYQTEGQDFVERGFFTGQVDLRTRLLRRFGAVRHLLEPRLGYAVVTHVGQRGNPLFVPATAVPQERIRHLDLRSVVADRADRVARAHTATLGLANRLYRDGAAGRPDALLADLTLSARYDIARQRFGRLLLDGRLAPWRGTTLRGHFGFDPERERVSEALAHLSWSRARLFGLSLEYRYLRDIPAFFEEFDPSNDRFEEFQALERVSQLRGTARVELGERWIARYTALYSLEDSLLLRNSIAAEYFSRCECWAAGLVLGNSRGRGVQVTVLYRFTGLGRGRRMNRVLLDDF